jgi:hypothetical protein
MHPSTNRSLGTRRITGVIGILIALLSAGPCIWGLAQIPPVVKYAQQTGENAALQIVIPIICAAAINALALALLAVSLFLREKA